MAEKFVVFEEAAKELDISVDELKQLVDDGKIRSFMDSGKMKVRRSDLDELKSSMGIGAEEEITLAPPEDVPDVPAPAAEAELPPPPPAEEDSFSIEPLDDESGPAPAPAAMAGGSEEEEVASLSDFEISEEVEEAGEELGEEEAELLSVQAPGFRAYEEPQAANMLMTVVLVASAIIVAFAAVTIMSFAWGVNPVKSITDFWPK